MKIGVLGGGVSAEREISLSSAKQVHKGLIDRNLDSIFIDISTKEENKVKKLIDSLSINLAFIALHGEFGEDGQIQKILEDLGIAYTGSGPKASALAMDKIQSKKIFKAKNILTPEFFICLKKENIHMGIEYPLVVKPCSSGSSMGISIVKDKNFLKDALDLAFSYSDEIILEKYIEGRELTVGILDNQPLAIVEIFPKKGHFDFNAKYSKGMCSYVAPASLSKGLRERIKDLGLAAHKALGCRDFSRVDIRLDKNNSPFVLEVNTIPGMTSHSLFPLAAKCEGLNFSSLIWKMTELGLLRYESRTVRQQV